jgi:hypothetical protein
VKDSLARFPKIPGVEHLGRANQTYAVFGSITARSAQTQYATLVPKTDADGNDLDGIRLPDITVPLGTHTGWALRADVPGEMCGNLGQLIPFAHTKAERNAARDPRLSLVERYPNQKAYLDQISKAVKDLQAQRLLLEEDLTAYLVDAERKVTQILTPSPKEPQEQKPVSGKKKP